MTTITQETMAFLPNETPDPLFQEALEFHQKMTENQDYMDIYTKEMVALKGDDPEKKETQKQEEREKQAILNTYQVYRAKLAPIGLSDDESLKHAVKDPATSNEKDSAIIEFSTHEKIKEFNRIIDTDELIRKTIATWEIYLQDDRELINDYHKKNFNKDKEYTEIYQELLSGGNDTQARKMAFYYQEVIQSSSRSKEDTLESKPETEKLLVSPKDIELTSIRPEKEKDGRQAKDDRLQDRINLIRQKAHINMLESSVFLGIGPDYPHTSDSKGILIPAINFALTSGLPIETPEEKARQEQRKLELIFEHRVTSGSDFSFNNESTDQIAKLDKQINGLQASVDGIEKEKKAISRKMNSHNPEETAYSDLSAQLSELMRKQRDIESQVDGIREKIDDITSKESKKSKEAALKRKSKLENFDTIPNIVATFDFFCRVLPKYVDEATKDSFNETLKILNKRADEKFAKAMENFTKDFKARTGEDLSPESALDRAGHIRQQRDFEKAQIFKIMTESAATQKLLLKASCILGIFSTPGRYIHRLAHGLRNNKKFEDYLNKDKNAMAPALNAYIDMIGPNAAQAVGGIYQVTSLFTTGVIKQNADYIASFLQYYSIQRTSQLELDLPLLTDEEKQRKRDLVKMASERLSPMRWGVFIMALTQIAGNALPSVLQQYGIGGQVTDYLRWLDIPGKVSDLNPVKTLNGVATWILEGIGVYATQAVIAKVSQRQNREVQDKEIEKLTHKEQKEKKPNQSKFFSGQDKERSQPPKPAVTVAPTKDEGDLEPLSPTHS